MKACLIYLWCIFWMMKTSPPIFSCLLPMQTSPGSKMASDCSQWKFSENLSVLETRGFLIIVTAIATTCSSGSPPQLPVRSRRLRAACGGNSDMRDRNSTWWRSTWWWSTRWWLCWWYTWWSSFDFWPVVRRRGGFVGETEFWAGYRCWATDLDSPEFHFVVILAILILMVVFI